jgi:flagellar M-ring protein FliF
MDFLRKMIASTHESLSTLGASQKLVIGLCVVVMAGALAWMFQWSGEPEWVPVLPGQLWTEEELEAARKVLEDGEFEVSGRQLLVRASQRRKVRSKLGQAGALPSDTRVGFESLMKETSPWKSQTQQSREWVVAYGNQLAMDLENWKGVRSAQVILQMPKRRGLGGRAVKPSASVSIGLEPGISWSKGLTESIASFVGGASGMPAENVHIINTGTHKSYRASGADGALSDDLLEKRRETEHYFKEKIHDQLAIPGVRVATFAELETDRRHETERTPTEGKSIEKRETKEETVENRKPAATEPGAQPNTGAALSSGGRVEESENSTRTTEFNSELGIKTTTTEYTVGALRRVSASINVPRSYLAGIFTRQPDAKDKTATDKDIDTIAERQFVKIRKLVVTAIGASDPNAVAVDWFDDQATLLVMGGGGGGDVDQADTVVGMLKASSSQIGLGFLALLSLGLMVMIVRKGPARAAAVRDGHPALSGEPEHLELLSAGLETIGEASSSETVLQGHEVDEGTIQTERQVDQVATLVKEDPDLAANLVMKWLGR